MYHFIFHCFSYKQGGEYVLMVMTVNMGYVDMFSEADTGRRGSGDKQDIN